MNTELIRHKSTVTKHNPKLLLTGSTSGKYPVVMDNGKTIVFISDKNKEDEIRLKYSEYGKQISAK